MKQCVDDGSDVTESSNVSHLRIRRETEISEE